MHVLITVRPGGVYVYGVGSTRTLWLNYGRTWADLLSRYTFPRYTRVFIR